MKLQFIFLLGSFMLFISCLSSEQKKTGNGYVINGNLKNSANKKIYLIEAPIFRSMVNIDSVICDTKGQFKFIGKVKEPAYYYLKNDLGDESSNFILENSLIRITGNFDSLQSLLVSGSRENEIKKMYDNVYRSNSDLLTKESSTKKSSEILEKDKKALKNILQFNIAKLINKYPQATASIFQLNSIIQQRNFKSADSLLKIYESSDLAHTEKVKYFRRQFNDLIKLAPGHNAPKFQMSDSFGKSVNLTSFRGKYVLLDFWASWCIPCRIKNPELIKCFNKYKNYNFTIVSISVDQNKSNWLKAIEKDKLTWTQLSDLGKHDNVVEKKYCISSIPSNYLIDDEGKIVAYNLFGSDLDEKLKSLLN